MNINLRNDTQVIRLTQTGQRGLRGQSAYDVAVENGFTGTESEWLLALKGDKGDAEAHADLTGLTNDDHTQYHNDARGDARYYVKSTVDSYLAGKLDKSGGAVDGDLYLYPHNTPTNNEGMPRTTRRLIIDSYDKSNKPNGHAGDAIALRWRDSSAKAFIGWWDYTGASPVLKAWIGAHDKANDGQSDHKHISIEVADSTGALQTRLEFPYDRDHTNIKTASADFTVNEGKLRVTAGNTAFKDLQYGLDAEDQTKNRWSLRTDNTTETGSNVGSDFRIIRYSDTGVAIDQPLFIKRSNGNVGVGTSDPTSQLEVNGTMSVKGTGTVSQSLDRGTTSNFGNLSFRTAGTEYHAIGFRNDGTNDLHFRNNGVSRLKINNNGAVEVNSNLVLSAPSIPTTATSSGAKGQVAYDANHVYVCIANNTWKRSPLTSW